LIADSNKQQKITLENCSAGTTIVQTKAAIVNTCPQKRI